MPLTSDDHKAFSDAIETGDSTTAARLLARYPVLVNHPDWIPPPIHCAILWNQKEIAALLFEHGANIEMLDPNRQTTPLRFAIMYAKTELIPLLLAKGAYTGPTSIDGPSALQLARQAAEGAFEDFDDLPRRDAYLPVIEILKELGVAD